MECLSNDSCFKVTSDILSFHTSQYSYFSNAEGHLKPCKTSIMEIFSENS